MKTPKLFYFLLGCTPEGRHTEQHDVFFCISDTVASAIPLIISFWPEAMGKIHVDAWREVTFVDGYRIHVKRRDDRFAKTRHLFFINLGGYLPGRFEEYHHKMVLVAPNMRAAVSAAKQSDFYKEYNIAANAASHIDNKYGVDVDDIFNVEEILPAGQKEQFQLVIEKTDICLPDLLHIGYFKLMQLGKNNF